MARPLTLADVLKILNRNIDVALSPLGEETLIDVGVSVDETATPTDGAPTFTAATPATTYGTAVYGKAQYQ